MNRKNIALKAVLITLVASFFTVIARRLGMVSLILSLLPGSSSLPKSSSGSVYDYYCLRTYSEIGEDDSDVLIVNISNYSRKVVGETVSRISEAGAKVIGIDVVFEKINPSDSNDLIAPLCRAKKNLVLGLSLEKSDGKGEWNTLKGSYFAKENSMDEAITNMYKKGREIGTTFSVSGEQYPFFPWAVARKYDSFLNERSVKDKYVNYKDYYYDSEYKPYDALRLIGDDEYFEDFKEAAEDKIVLLGVISKNEDRHFIPSGDYIPGILLHAYAVSSIIHHNFIKNIPAGHLWFISALLCFLLTWLFYYFEKNTNNLYTLVYKIIELLVVFGCHHLGLFAFRHGLFIDLTCFFIIYSFSQVLIFFSHVLFNED